MISNCSKFYIQHIYFGNFKPRRPGDVFYIPDAWWHEVYTSGQSVVGQSHLDLEHAPIHFVWC